MLRNSNPQKPSPGKDEITNESWLITAIEPVKRNPERRAIFLNHIFAFTIGSETINLFPLAINQVLTAKQREIIERHEQYENAKAAALKYLGRCMRSQRELVNYLRRKGFPSSVSARVINYCLEHQYLDDHQFAETFVRDKLRLSHDGILKIKSALSQKGVAPEIVEQVCTQLVNTEELLQRAIVAGQKKLKMLPPSEKNREKLLRFLTQKGYPLTIVLSAVKEIFDK